MTGRVPLLPVGSTILATLPADLADTAALALREDLADRVARTGATGVVLDLTAVRVVDSFLARVINDIAAVCRMLAAETTVVGMRPELAITMVELGLTLPGLRKAATLAAALGLPPPAGRTP